MTDTYRGFVISYDPKPIPIRMHDYNFVHEEYDGPEDKRIGTGASVQDCKDAIDDMLWKPECECCQGTGKIETENRFSVDTGTKWQRNYVQTGILEQCDECQGKGTVTQ